MSDYAAVYWLKGRLNGLAVPPLTPTLQAIVSPVPLPLATTTTGARAFIWPVRERETHPTMSGMTGQRRVTFQPLMVELRNVYDAQDPNIDKWLQVVDAVKAQIRTSGTSIPIAIDGTVQPSPSSAGTVAIITAIAEEMSTEYPQQRVRSNMPFTAIARVMPVLQLQIQATYTQ